MSKPKTHAEYIRAFPSNVQKKLRELRAIVLKAAPKAQKKISYGVAAFEMDGPIVYIGGFKNHVSLFPTSSGVRAFKAELKDYKASAGAIQFSLDQPLPKGLIQKIVRFRVQELKKGKSKK